MTQSKRMAKKHRIRKLEELNLMDDFLFQEMVAQEGDGEEFVRILLKTILGKTIRRVKIVPQKNILGIDTNKHGIRLDAYIEEVADDIFPAGEILDAKITSDIYDIEPNQKYERRSLPRRMRYYHGLIDTQLLSNGIQYDNLQNVIIIVILPYDPFGKNRMVYTVQNQCVEDGSVFYDDGARKIFLYTRGTEGNPSQELRDMLKYIEKTTEENVTNQDIESVNRLVDKLKRKREVGINYMKSWEREEMVRDEGRKEGREEGAERKLISMVCKKMAKEKTVAEIADELEEAENVISRIYDAAKQYAPSYDVDAIYEEMFAQKEG